MECMCPRIWDLCCKKMKMEEESIKIEEGQHGGRSRVKKKAGKTQGEVHVLGKEEEANRGDRCQTVIRCIRN